MLSWFVLVGLILSNHFITHSCIVGICDHNWFILDVMWVCMSQMIHCLLLGNFFSGESFILGGAITRFVIHYKWMGWVKLLWFILPFMEILLILDPIVICEARAFRLAHSVTYGGIDLDDSLRYFWRNSYYWFIFIQWMGFILLRFIISFLC